MLSLKHMESHIVPPVIAHPNALLGFMVTGGRSKCQNQLSDAAGSFRQDPGTLDGVLSKNVDELSK